MARYLDLQGAVEANDIEDAERPMVQGNRSVVNRRGMAVTSAVLVAGGALVLLLQRGQRLPGATKEEVVGLASVQYENLGYGKCTNSAGGSEVAHEWYGSGDMRAKCNSKDDCKGYSPSYHGGGLLWLEEGLKGGGDAWGSCNCYVKVSAADTTTQAPPVPVDPPPTLSPAAIADAKAEADASGAKTFPNAHLIAAGYNVFYADPMPKIRDRTSSDINMDPGLRKPVFAIEYKTGRLTGDRRHKRPDGYFATVDYGCSEVFSTKTLSDAYEFTSERNMEGSISGQLGLDIDVPPTSDQFSFSHGDMGIQDTGGGPMSLGAFVGGTATLSGSYKSIKKDDMFQDSRLVVSNAKCAVYTAGIAYGYPPNTHPDFKAAVEAAGDKKAWFGVFDDYGTHYMSNVQMGARFGTTLIFGKSHYEAMTHTLIKAGVEVGPVIEAGVKTAISMPEIEDTLSIEFNPSASIPDIPIMNQKEIKTLNSFASAQTLQGVGPLMPTGGASAWMDLVEKNPVPLRFSKIEICAHPGLSTEQRKSCADALSKYCKEHLESKGAECDPAVKRQCQLDEDCNVGSVCREYICQKVPVCYVSVFSSTHYNGHEYTLDPVDAVSNPDGKPTSLKTDAWHDKIESLRLGKGCKKVKFYDDDSGSFGHGAVNNEEATQSQGSLNRDLNHDVWQVWVWANDVPGTPPFQPGSGADPGNVGTPPAITFNPEQDTMYAEPPQPGSGFSHASEGEFFPNIGKAMYGYNHYHGAPFSTKYAGTDPGFQGRGVWKMSYSGGALGEEGVFNRLPMAPKARYFLLFAAKHPQLDQLKEDAADPLAAAKREFRGSLDHLVNLEKKFEDGSKGFYDHRNFYQNNDYQKKDWKEPDIPVSPPDDEYCGLQNNITLAIGRIDNLASTKFKDDYEEYWNSRGPMYGWRRLYGNSDYDADDPKHDHYRNVGDKFCRNGKLKEWAKADKDKAEAAYQPPPCYYDCWGGPHRRLAAKSTKPATNSTPRSRELEAAEKAAVTARRLYSSDANSWFSVDDKPNLREFGSLAKAKQALRSEARCIGNFAKNFQCPSGADYNINMEGTTWEFSKYSSYDGYYDHVDPKEELAGKLKNHWPRFIVKVLNGDVDAVEEIDTQDQTAGWRTGFDSVIPATGPRTKMIESLKKHVEENPDTKATIEDPKAIDIKVPNGWKITRAKGGGFCEQDMKTDQINDAHSYEKLTSSTFGIPKTSAYVAGSGFSFGLSYEKKETMKMNGQKSEKMFATQAECGTYYAEIVDLENNPPETEPSLAFLSGKAAKEEDFYIIFDQYGLHFPTEMLFGARYGTTQYIKQSAFESFQSKSEALSLDFGVQASIPTKVPGVDIQASRDVSIGYEGTDTEAHSSQKYFNERRTFSVGRRLPQGGVDEWMKDISGEDMPIKFSFAPMCDHPAFKDQKSLCKTASDNYCKKHLKRKNPDLSCEATPKSECLWDIDCENPHTHRCTRLGQCEQRPACSVTLYSGGNYDGESKTIGPQYYADHEPYKIVDLSNVGWSSWAGKTNSMKISGGCAKIVKMGDNNLNAEGNFAKTNHKTNSEQKLGGVRHCNYVALFPKEYYVDEGSEWFAYKG